MLQDARWRFLVPRNFEFTALVSVDLDSKIDKCRSACGLFGHGGGACDHG